MFLLKRKPAKCTGQIFEIKRGEPLLLWFMRPTKEARLPLLNCHSFFLKVSSLSRMLTPIFTCMLFLNFRIQHPMTGKSDSPVCSVKILFILFYEKVSIGGASLLKSLWFWEYTFLLNSSHLLSIWQLRTLLQQVVLYLELYVSTLWILKLTVPYPGVWCCHKMIICISNA